MYVRGPGDGYQIRGDTQRHVQVTHSTVRLLLTIIDFPPSKRAAVCSLQSCVSRGSEEHVEQCDGGEATHQHITLQPPAKYIYILQVPQMRRMGGCITDHDSCVEHSILLTESAHHDTIF